MSEAERLRPEGESRRYVNRETSWLAFNRRVLAEAERQDNPVLERLKFVSIFESNLDEFYMVRVSGLFEQLALDSPEPTPDGLTPAEQLALIGRHAPAMRRHAGQVWQRELRPVLARFGVRVRAYDDLSADARVRLTAFFESEVFPLCTPLLLHPATSWPFISNRSLNLAVELVDDGESLLARVKVPSVLPRLVPVPGRPFHFVLLEDLLANHLHLLFPGVEVVGSFLFRVLRDADIEIRELEAADLITAVEQSLRLRRFGEPVLLQVEPSASGRALEVLRQGLGLDVDDVWEVDGLLGLEVLMELAALDLPGLKWPSHVPEANERLSGSANLFAAIRERDVLVHHPYDSFRAVEEFVWAAANDPQVLGIKQTLYRVGAESPIVQALLAAAEAGKQVTAMVELKARFDESQNLGWSRALERAGVHVAYGFREMKTHCKLCLVVRREPEGLRSYAHIGTGNYNPTTARLYTDFGLFTCDREVCKDVAEVFNYLTGVPHHHEYRKLLVAPLNLREEVIERIEREAESCRTTGSGRIALKLNSLVDPEVIDALYEASQAGVQVDLIVRGVCCLRPGVPGLSPTIRVVSVVGRFLEHSRAYYFENGGNPEMLMGSADMMRRNLDRRIEVLAPVRDPAHVAYIRDEVFDSMLRDNRGAWEMLPSGRYQRVARPPDGVPFDSQRYLMGRPASMLTLSG